MTAIQQEVFELCRPKVFAILYEQNPYMTTKSLAIALLKDWTAQAHSVGHSLDDCPFEPIPKKNVRSLYSYLTSKCTNTHKLTKMYARVKSGLISEVSKKIQLYYDVPSKDGVLSTTFLTSLLKNHAYLLPEPTEAVSICYSSPAIDSNFC